MLEWYRAREDYETIIADTLALVQLAARSGGHAAVPLARAARPIPSPAPNG